MNYETLYYIWNSEVYSIVCNKKYTIISDTEVSSDNGNNMAEFGKKCFYIVMMKLLQKK
jgi:hypothetical protein